MTERQFQRWIVKLDDGILWSRDRCWFWQGAKTRSGYGNFMLTKTPPKYVAAHRIAYEHYRGPIPEGLHLDHLCRNRSCVNPWHLEPVTNRENAQRGARGRMVTHCRNGHPYNEENTMWRKNGRRGCRACARETMARKRAAGYIAPSRRKGVAEYVEGVRA